VNPAFVPKFKSRKYDRNHVTCVTPQTRPDLQRGSLQNGRKLTRPTRQGLKNRRVKYECQARIVDIYLDKM